MKLTNALLLLLKHTSLCVQSCSCLSSLPPVDSHMDSGRPSVQPSAHMAVERKKNKKTFSQFTEKNIVLLNTLHLSDGFSTG